MKKSNIPTSHLTLGKHRDNLRLWIEGKRLALAGFENKAPYSAEFEPGKVTLKLTFEGDRNVAGTPARPIIDINSKQLSVAFGDHVEKVCVYYFPNKIIVIPAI